MAHDDKRPDPAPEDGPATSSESAENRLAAESSPYLLLHRHNPVDWYPWGEEALAKAREEDKPIFLSVGYSTCYWCHVMERESFSDPQIAAQMNRDLVNVKVDREERPDLDEIYMTATQILTGHGGWPNSVFLTPDLKPFYAGTYFPPEDRYGRPGFPSLLRGLVEAWQGRRTEVEQQAEELSGAMRRYIEERAEPGDAPPPASVREASAKGLFQRFDPEWGGFGGAPKFPSPSNLVLLLEVARGSGSREAAPDAAKAADMLHATLDQMARGGIYDQLAGGFHRYATDRAWRVPHFEKMLYDNGLLLDLYAREHARTKDPEMERIVRETAAFLEREMTLPGGGFASAIDAETDGHEGAYYVWTRDELQQVLGREDFDFLAPLLGFAGVPFFEDKYFVLHLPERLEVQAQRRRGSREDLLDEMEPMRRKLLEARQERKRPLTDDKVLADWNGMTIAGLATAGHLLGEELFVERAARAASFVLAELRPEGRLHHTWRGGEAKVHGLLGDYVWMVRGLLALHEATGEGDWVAAAAELAQEQKRYLADERGGYFVAEERPDLLFRSKEVFDGAVPAANAVAVLNLLDLAAATGEERWHREAERVLAASAPLVEQFPDGARTLAVAAARWHAAERRGTPEEAAAEGTPVARGGTVATGTVAEGSAGAGAGGGKAAPEAGASERGAGDSPAAPPAGAAALAAEAEKTAETRVEVGSADPEGWHAFVLRLRLAEGWHANAGSVEDPSLVATAVGAEDAGLRALELPPGEPWSAGGSDEDPHPVYRGRVEIRGELRAAGPAPALLLTWQPCDETRCLPPVTRRLPVLG